MREQTLAVQRMQDYIETHLDSEITPAGLAQASLYSPWYSYRLFRRCLGLTPAEYVRRLRLARAAMRLRDGGARVIDVAGDLGFGSADTFTRAFYREFGVNPGDYARSPQPLPLFVPYGAKYRELRKEQIKMSDSQVIFIQTIRKPERCAVIRRGVAAEDYFPYCEEVGCDVWGILLSMAAPGSEPVSLWLPAAYRAPGTSVYVQGVEVPPDYAGPVPEGFDVIHLPAADYLMFQGEPFAEEDYCEAIERVRAAMDRYDPSVAGLRWDDENPRIQLEPRGERGYIELRAVKPRG